MYLFASVTYYLVASIVYSPLYCIVFCRHVLYCCEVPEVCAGNHLRVAIQYFPCYLPHVPLSYHRLLLNVTGDAYSVIRP